MQLAIKAYMAMISMCKIQEDRDPYLVSTFHSMKTFEVKRLKPQTPSD